MENQNTKFQKLLDILVCPLCRGKLTFDHKKREFICKTDQLAYPVREDIPVMLVSEARKIEST